jgi:dihydrofolate reductase
MRNVVYSMSVSADGYIAGPDGSFAWTPPDEEIHRFAADQVRELDVHLMGRRLYETMLYWETAEEDPALADYMLEFAAIWKAVPKVVFSRSLERVEGNATLVRGGLAEELERLKSEPGGGNIAIGGATLAGQAARLGLIDEYQLRVHPVAVGGGTPYFPQDLERPIALELTETRTFVSRVVYLSYRALGR